MNVFLNLTKKHDTIIKCCYFNVGLTWDFFSSVVKKRIFIFHSNLKRPAKLQKESDYSTLGIEKISSKMMKKCSFRNSK